MSCGMESSVPINLWIVGRDFRGSQKERDCSNESAGRNEVGKRGKERSEFADYVAKSAVAPASIKRIIKSERVSCDPFEEPEMQILKKEKERRM